MQSLLRKPPISHKNPSGKKKEAQNQSDVVSLNSKNATIAKNDGSTVVLTNLFNKPKVWTDYLQPCQDQEKQLNDILELSNVQSQFDRPETVNDSTAYID